MSRLRSVLYAVNAPAARAASKCEPGKQDTSAPFVSPTTTRSVVARNTIAATRPIMGEGFAAASAAFRAAEE